MAASWVANKWATSDTSRGMQYAGLGLYVVAEAIIFLPLLLIAVRFTGQSHLVGQAAIITLGLFAGLTFVAFTTKKDFSFLGGVLKISFFVAFGLIAASLLMGFNLGIWFSGAMVLFAGISILYQTSNIIHNYRPDQHVAASLGLFASVALLFWYVLQILMSLSSSD
jgi:FtsH-binding integral membrane protein